MTSHTGEQTITMHILPNISQSKDNQTMKFVKLVEYNTRKAFLQKSCREWGSEISSRPILFFKKLYMSWKQVLCNKNKLYKTLDYWSRDMLDFDFLEKGLRIVSLAYFLYDFSKKSVSHVILTDQISMSDCFYFLRYLAICVLLTRLWLCLLINQVNMFVNQVVTSNILKSTWYFEIKPFLYMTKKSRQKFKHLENETSF